MLRLHGRVRFTFRWVESWLWKTDIFILTTTLRSPPHFKNNIYN